MASLRRGPLIGFAHKSEIHLIRNSRTLLNAEASCKATQSSRSGYKEKDAISQLQLMEMKMGQVMVVLSYTGLVHVSLNTVPTL